MSQQSGDLKSARNYTAVSDEPGHLLVYMPGSQYGMGVDEARRFMESLRLAINAAELVCDDCGVKDSSVERSGCPDAIKHGHGASATLCEDCFFRRDQITETSN